MSTRDLAEDVEALIREHEILADNYTRLHEDHERAVDAGSADKVLALSKAMRKISKDVLYSDLRARLLVRLARD